MRKSICFIILLHLIVFSAISFANANIDSKKGIYNNISVEAIVDSHEIPSNKQLTYEIRINWSGEVDSYSFDEVPQLKFYNLEIKGSKIANQMLPDGEYYKGTKTFTYVLKPVKEGKAQIFPAAINYYEKNAASQKN